MLHVGRSLPKAPCSNGFHRAAWSRWLHLLALLGVLLGAGCDAIFGDSGDSPPLIIMDGGVCIKDRDVLTGLLAQPRSCASSTECPGGSFCELASGRCEWDCFAN